MSIESSLSQSWLTFKKVTYRRDSSLILDNISFSVGSSRRVWLSGPSGTGKTTLLRIVAGHLKLCEGNCLFQGREVTAPSADRAIVMQAYKLFPWMTAAENVASGMRFKKESADTVLRETQMWLAQAGLSESADFYPHQLSGGMCQRISVLRALAVKPSCLLLDEPFSALDEENTQTVLNLLDNYLAQPHTTCLIACHNMRYAREKGDTILSLKGNGTVQFVDQSVFK